MSFPVTQTHISHCFCKGRGEAHGSHQIWGVVKPTILGSSVQTAQGQDLRLCYSENNCQGREFCFFFLWDCLKVGERDAAFIGGQPHGGGLFSEAAALSQPCSQGSLINMRIHQASHWCIGSLVYHQCPLWGELKDTYPKKKKRE